MKGRERPCSIKPQLRSSPNVLQRSVEPAAEAVIRGSDVIEHCCNWRTACRADAPHPMTFVPLGNECVHCGMISLDYITPILSLFDLRDPTGTDEAISAVEIEMYLVVRNLELEHRLNEADLLISDVTLARHRKRPAPPC